MFIQNQLILLFVVLASMTLETQAGTLDSKACGVQLETALGSTVETLQKHRRTPIRDATDAKRAGVDDGIFEIARSHVEKQRALHPESRVYSEPNIQGVYEDTSQGSTVVWVAIIVTRKQEGEEIDTVFMYNPDLSTPRNDSTSSSSNGTHNGAYTDAWFTWRAIEETQ